MRKLFRFQPTQMVDRNELKEARWRSKCSVKMPENGQFDRVLAVKTNHSSAVEKLLAKPNSDILFVVQALPV